jgi:hypothetical protein
LTSAWTLPVTRSMLANKLTGRGAHISCSRAKVAWTPHFVRLHLFLAVDLVPGSLRRPWLETIIS